MGRRGNAAARKGRVCVLLCCRSRQRERGQKRKRQNTVPYAEHPWPWADAESADTPHRPSKKRRKRTRERNKDPLHVLLIPYAVHPWSWERGDAFFFLVFLLISYPTCVSVTPNCLALGGKACADKTRGKRENDEAGGPSRCPAQCASARSSCTFPSPRRTCGRTSRRRAGRGAPAERQSRARRSR